MMKTIKPSGFSLIEVLIALVVLSFGVLTTLGLQVVASSNVQNANQRTTAVHLANDLLERIRINAKPDANAVYLKFTLNSELGGGSLQGKSVNCYTGSSCSPADMALYDLAQWEALMDGSHQTAIVDGQAVASGGLVDPAACLFGPAAGGDGLYQLVIVWRSATESENPLLNNIDADGCANDADRYGAGNTHRRVVAISTYISR